MQPRPKILIAGAGIGGLAAALSLLRRGFDADIFEQSPDLCETNGPLLVATNTAGVLHALGLHDALQSYGDPPYTIDRAELRRLLIDAVRQEKPGAIHVDARCLDFMQTPTGVRLRLANGDEVSGEALVGADDARSTIGHRLGTELPPFTGRVTLLGAAGRGPSSSQAQHTAGAIEDGYALALCAGRNPGDLASAWRQYEQERAGHP